MLVSAAPRLALEWLRHAHGPEAEGRAIALTSTRHGIDLHEELRHPWVPFRVHLALLESLEALGFSTYEFQALGRYSAGHLEHVMPGAALVLKLASPERLLRVAPTLWRTYADFGHLEAHPEGHHMELRLRDVPATPAFCATLQGFFHGLLERSGGHDASVEHHQCAAHGCSACVFSGRWT